MECIDWQVAGLSIAGVNDLGLLAICAIERDIQIPVAGKEKSYGKNNKVKTGGLSICCAFESEGGRCNPIIADAPGLYKVR